MNLLVCEIHGEFQPCFPTADVIPMELKLVLKVASIDERSPSFASGLPRGPTFVDLLEAMQIDISASAIAATASDAALASSSSGMYLRPSEVSHITFFSLAVKFIVGAKSG